MGLFDFVRGLPEWAKQLPPHLRPSSDQIRRLEAIRMEFGISHPEFLRHVAGHSETTRRVQKHSYTQIKQQMPRAQEHEVLKELLLSRLRAAAGVGMDLFGLAALAEDNAAFVARINEVVAKYPTLDSLIDAMLEEERRRDIVVPPAPGFADAARRVAEILAER